MCYVVLLTLVFFLCGQFKVKSCRLLLMYLLASYGTIPILRHQIDWVGGVKLIFAYLQHYIYAYIWEVVPERGGVGSEMSENVLT